MLELIATGASSLPRLSAVLALAALTGGCGQTEGEFAGNGILLGKVVFCDAPTPNNANCRPRNFRHPPHVSAIARAIDGTQGRSTGDIDLSLRNGGRAATFRWSLAPARYRATLRPRTLRGLAATTATFTITKGSTTTITLAYAPPP